jgi:hypothetical protein
MASWAAYHLSAWHEIADRVTHADFQAIADAARAHDEKELNQMRGK